MAPRRFPTCPLNPCAPDKYPSVRALPTLPLMRVLPRVSVFLWALATPLLFDLRTTTRSPPPPTSRSRAVPVSRPPPPPQSDAAELSAAFTAPASNAPITTASAVAAQPMENPPPRAPTSYRDAVVGPLFRLPGAPASSFVPPASNNRDGAPAAVASYRNALLGRLGSTNNVTEPLSLPSLSSAPSSSAEISLPASSRVLP